MVNKAQTTKKAATKTVEKKPVKKPAKKTIAKPTTKSTKVPFHPNLVIFLVSIAAITILFSLALIVTI